MATLHTVDSCWITVDKIRVASMRNAARAYGMNSRMHAPRCMFLGGLLTNVGLEKGSWAQQVLLMSNMQYLC